MGTVEEKSALGTLSYWSNLYQQEIDNFQVYGDTGEVWFGKHLMQQLINYISQHSDIFRYHSILDVGCGNGTLLVELARDGFENLYGIDYCEKAIELANLKAEQQQLGISYFVADILDDAQIKECYNVVLDKGTFDTVCLASDGSSDGVQRLVNTYISSIHRLLYKNGYFILTSCNWTRDELLAMFQPQFTLEDELKSSQFQFGGVTGNTSTTLVFRLSQ